MQFLKTVLTITTLLIGFQEMFAQCGQNNHSTNPNDSWLSCETATIPNSNEPTNYHWIYYDLGYTYSLEKVKLWNYNVSNETGKGIKDGEIFYSDDGQNWTSGGIFELPEANGHSNYEGWEGIDLEGIMVRFITIVAYSNWSGEDCTGLSEVRFTIINQTTSLNRQEVSVNEMLVFPNPTNQILTVQLTKKQPIQELILLNNAGHEILRRTKNQNLNQLDVSQLPSGIYLLNVLTANQQLFTKRFIKTGL